MDLWWLFLGAAFLFVGTTVCAGGRAMNNSSAGTGSKAEDLGTAINVFGAGVVMLGSAGTVILDLGTPLCGVVAIIVIVLIVFTVLSGWLVKKSKGSDVSKSPFLLGIIAVTLAWVPDKVKDKS